MGYSKEIFTIQRQYENGKFDGKRFDSYTEQAICDGERWEHDSHASGEYLPENDGGLRENLSSDSESAPF